MDRIIEVGSRARRAGCWGVWGRFDRSLVRRGVGAGGRRTMLVLTRSSGSLGGSQKVTEGARKLRVEKSVKRMWLYS